jgi:hypothetical protein
MLADKILDCRVVNDLFDLLSDERSGAKFIYVARDGYEDLSELEEIGPIPFWRLVAFLYCVLRAVIRKDVVYLMLKSESVTRVEIFGTFPPETETPDTD